MLFCDKWRKKQMRQKLNKKRVKVISNIYPTDAKTLTGQLSIESL